MMLKGMFLGPEICVTRPIL